VRDPILPPLAALGSRGGTDRFSLKPSLSELIRPHIHSFNFLLQHSNMSVIIIVLIVSLLIDVPFRSICYVCPLLIEGGLAQSVEDLRHGLIDPVDDFPGCSCTYISYHIT
jgi:hypothetical protein